MLRAIKALLPSGLAFNINSPVKNLRKFWNSIVYIIDDPSLGRFTPYVQYMDNQYYDLFPQTTRELERWEEAFGLTISGLSEQQRRDNLAAAWQETGGQTKAYIQGALRAKGFDVYVYDWWEEPLTDPPVARDPNDAEYVLKNKITFSQVNEDFSAGADIAEAGGPQAESGYAAAVTIGLEPVEVPTDIEKWKNFIYISGANFGDPITIPAGRKDEFDALVLKLRPLDKWVGINPTIIP